MDPRFQAVFDLFSGYEVGLVGSVTKDYEAAHDIDVLFTHGSHFDDACERFGLKSNSWDSGTGKIRRANLTNYDKPIQLLWVGSVKEFTDHPYMVILRDGEVLHPGKWYQKPAGGYDKEISVDRRKEKKMIVAMDFDGTIRDWDTSKPLPGVRKLINLLREKGVKIIIHSCNTPDFIEKWMNNQDIRYDEIWNPKVGRKPIAALYVDDRGFHATGDYELDTPKILERLGL